MRHLYPLTSFISGCRRLSVDLTAHEVRLLDETMRLLWKDWITKMPEGFTEDFFLLHQPITVSYRYGQNQPIRSEMATMAQIKEEMAAFSRDRDMKYVRLFSFALACEVK